MHTATIWWSISICHTMNLHFIAKRWPAFNWSAAVLQHSLKSVYRYELEILASTQSRGKIGSIRPWTLLPGPTGPYWREASTALTFNPGNGCSHTSLFTLRPCPLGSLIFFKMDGVTRIANSAAEIPETLQMSCYGNNNLRFVIADFQHTYNFRPIQLLLTEIELVSVLKFRLVFPLSLKS